MIIRPIPEERWAMFQTRAAYARALRQFDAWRGERANTAAALAAYLGTLFEAGRASATAALVVAAVTFRTTLGGADVRGPLTEAKDIHLNSGTSFREYESSHNLAYSQGHTCV